MIVRKPWELTADDLGRTLDAEARRVTALAHRPERWILAGEAVPPDQRFSIRVANWQSRVRYYYSVDRAPVVFRPLVQRAHEPVADTKPTEEEVWRHLSIQLSVPESLSKAEVQANKVALVRLYEPQAAAFFPLDSALRIHIDVSDPIPVVRPGRLPSGQRAHPVHFRTVITVHFLAPWGGGTAPYRRPMETQPCPDPSAA